MTRAQGARAQMALGFESAYGTPPLASHFWKMPFANSNLGSEQGLIDSELLGYGRDPLMPVKDAINVEGDITIPLDPRFLGIWLKALFGAPTTTGASAPYTHTFASGGWSLPSMAIEIGMPEVPFYAMNKGVVANSLEFTMQRSGLITGKVNCIAQGETKAASSSAGTLNALTFERFGAFQGAIKRDGVSLGSIVSAQVMYSNNLDKIEVIRNDGMIDGADPSMAKMSGTMDVRFADTTLFDQAVNGTSCALEFSYAIDANRSFKLTAHAVYLPKPKVALQGPGGVQASFAWQAAYDATATRMATAVLVCDQANFNNP